MSQARDRSNNSFIGILLFKRERGTRGCGAQAQDMPLLYHDRIPVINRRFFGK